MPIDMTQLLETDIYSTATSGVCFDPELIVLQGVYLDELSLFRAKRVWQKILETCFLLELKRDFQFECTRDYSRNYFLLRCTFISACGRYAFWRLTNHQAPEAQYEIETAHIPDSLSRHEDFVNAPDMKPVNQEVAALSGLESEIEQTSNFTKWLHSVIHKIGKSI